jgi:hypothetical protein
MNILWQKIKTTSHPPPRKKKFPLTRGALMPACKCNAYRHPHTSSDEWSLSLSRWFHPNMVSRTQTRLMIKEKMCWINKQIIECVIDQLMRAARVSLIKLSAACLYIETIIRFTDVQMKTRAINTQQSYYLPFNICANKFASFSS